MIKRMSVAGNSLALIREDCCWPIADLMLGNGVILGNRLGKRKGGRMQMLKRLSIVGNSLALIIERPILRLLDIDQETLLEISTDGVILKIRPLHKDSPELKEAMAAGKIVVRKRRRRGRRPIIEK